MFLARSSFLFMGQLPELMTVAEVAEALRLADETVHRWCREGRIKYVNILGLKRFHRAYIEYLVTGGELSMLAAEDAAEGATADTESAA